MNAVAELAAVASPASLPSPALARRLADLCGEERNVQVDFLLHLAEFDSRRAWAAAGYGSLWAYCLEVLHLREGAAYRRIEAMKALRRFPALEAPLREGRLSLTTVNLLAPVLTEENLAELVARAAFLSKADTERLVVSIRPRVAPRDGIRRIAAPVAAPTVAPPVDATPVPALASALVPSPSALAPISAAAGSTALTFVLEAVPRPPAPAPRAELRPVGEDSYSLRVTLDAAAKAELDRLVDLLSHKTGGDLAAVVGEAVRCALEKHGKRKGAVAPERKTAKKAAAGAKAPPASAPSPGSRTIPMEVKREVWARDGGKCAWTSPDGKRCGSTWRLEFGHVKQFALGGLATVDNVRVECGQHNQYEAERIFGRDYMARCRATSSSGSDGR